MAGDKPNTPNYNEDFPMNTQMFELCLVAILIPFVFLKNMKYLAPFSFFANLATLAGLLLLCKHFADTHSTCVYLWFHFL